MNQPTPLLDELFGDHVTLEGGGHADIIIDDHKAEEILALLLLPSQSQPQTPAQEPSA